MWPVYWKREGFSYVRVVPQNAEHWRDVTTMYAASRDDDDADSAKDDVPFLETTAA